jgi:hypothetical protein
MQEKRLLLQKSVKNITSRDKYTIKRNCRREVDVYVFKIASGKYDAEAMHNLHNLVSETYGVIMHEGVNTKKTKMTFVMASLWKEVPKIVYDVDLKFIVGYYVTLRSLIELADAVAIYSHCDHLKLCQGEYFLSHRTKIVISDRYVPFLPRYISEKLANIWHFKKDKNLILQEVLEHNTDICQSGRRESLSIFTKYNYCGMCHATAVRGLFEGSIPVWKFDSTEDFLWKLGYIPIKPTGKAVARAVWLHRYIYVKRPHGPYDYNEDKDRMIKRILNLDDDLVEEKFIEWCNMWKSCIYARDIEIRSAVNKIKDSLSNTKGAYSDIADFDCRILTIYDLEEFLSWIRLYSCVHKLTKKYSVIIYGCRAWISPLSNGSEYDTRRSYMSFIHNVQTKEEMENMKLVKLRRKYEIEAELAVLRKLPYNFVIMDKIQEAIREDIIEHTEDELDEISYAPDTIPDYNA